jgi:hypothetical protein
MAGLPLKQTVQNTVSGLGDGAGVAATTGADVSSPEHPHVPPNARLCATRQSAGFNPGPRGPPNAATSPHVTISPKIGENKNAFGSVTTPLKAQISHGNKPCKVGVGAFVGMLVGEGDGTGVGSV